MEIRLPPAESKNCLATPQLKISPWTLKNLLPMLASKRRRSFSTSGGRRLSNSQQYAVAKQLQWLLGLLAVLSRLHPRVYQCAHRLRPCPRTLEEAGVPVDELRPWHVTVQSVDEPKVEAALKPLGRKRPNPKSKTSIKLKRCFFACGWNRGGCITSGGEVTR